MDALSKAEPVLRLTEACRDPERFLTLDDSLPSLIRSWNIICGCSTPLPIQEAQAILKRIDSGDHYVCCGEVLVPRDAPR